MNDTRQAQCRRQTSETDIDAELRLSGRGTTEIETGLGFFDHMLTALGRHGRFDLRLHCKGDLHIDDHHTVEDCALVLGQCFDEALGDRRGIRRFADATVVMDEALCRVAIDLSGRPFAAIDLDLQREMIGQVATENLSHFFRSFAEASRAGLHVDVLKGANDHHKSEAAFKALALCLRDAVRIEDPEIMPSTKGVL